VTVRESDISPFVAAWLESKGYTVYAEVPHRRGAIDLVGLRGAGTFRRIVTVELKRGLNRDVVCQAIRHVNAADETWCVCVSTPRPDNPSIQHAARSGVGVAVVREERVEVLYAPFRRESALIMHAWTKLWARALKKGPGCVGGLASACHTPARDVYRKVIEMRRADPSVTWAAMYAAIPNHYASAKSLKGSMERYEKFHPNGVPCDDDIPT